MRDMGNAKEWMYLPRQLPEFEAGVIEFLNASFGKAAKGSQIYCPCKWCKNRYWHRRDVVFDHLKGHGFVDDYYNLHGLSNVAFDDLLLLLKEMIPEAKLPSSFTEARKIVRDLGLDYKKIPACPNDCMLYWKEDEHIEVYRICNTSKWKQMKDDEQKKHDTKHMTWHDKGRPKDGNLRHPADGQSWKEFDSLYPHFAKETRNVRLGLSSDGFNPFGTMSIAHSTWPVVLVNYNLPPWMSLKSEYFMLSLLIPGPKSPGNNIDIHLQPLIEELKELWINGLETYDKSNDETFEMCAALMWTISDFPAYSMLSGWKTKFLDAQHPWRRNKSAFNGKIEKMVSPKPLSGADALSELHNLDVMHIEKNICDNVIWTLLDISGKSKDHPKARFDILELGIKERLQPVLSNDGKHVIIQKAGWVPFFEAYVARLDSGVCPIYKHTELDDTGVVNEVEVLPRRYLCKLKSYVRNMGRPEGSIAEGYLIEECLTFCSRYMHGVNESVNKGVEDNDDLMDMLSYIAQANDQETCLPREDIPPLIVEANTKLASTDVIDKDNGDDLDYDDTLWDWMHADEDDDN
ncbi:hypothetical protein E3N88_06763 [Mikania micrantha]|uniref:DUF4218 domain-containing protein n=1 Tax=Mikania micrantha TaxID=192012 RepID=A0A5N6PRQ0_9ASTR|nr:hypothetical protein E3N88_06763 [Mikania micrantha]